jgi:hypothetical protein
MRICVVGNVMVVSNDESSFVPTFVFQNRLKMENKSHMTEMMQKTRIELENGDISDEEKNEAIRVSKLTVKGTFGDFLGRFALIMHYMLFCRPFDSIHLGSNV